MTTLVTGGSGILGSALVRRIVQEEGRAVSIDMNPSPFFLRGRHVDLDKVEMAVGDISDEAFVGSVIDEYRVDKVVHTASSVGSVSNAYPMLSTKTNCVGTVALLEACRTRDIRRVVLSSTITVYGQPARYSQEQLPLNESSLLTTHPKYSPVYAAGKIFLEAAGHWYRDEYGMEIAGMRTSWIGSAGRAARYPHWNLSGQYVDAVACGREVRLDSAAGRVQYIYVEDVVEQYWTLLNVADATLFERGPFFNDGAVAHDITEIVEILRELVPDAVLEVAAEDRATEHNMGVSGISGQAFADAFGYKPKYGLRDGLAAWIEEARQWPDLFDAASRGPADLVFGE